MAKGPTLGEILRQARTNMGVSLREVEEKTNISNAYLSQLESGTVKDPSPHKLLALSKYFDVQYATLMEAAGYIMPSPDKKAQTLNSVQALLLTEQPLTDDESRAMTAFLIQYRQLTANRPAPKLKRDGK